MALGLAFCSGSGGRALSITIPLVGQRTWVVGCGYAPVSSESSAIRQAFYDEVSTSVGCANSQTVVSFFLDANASPGIGVRSKDRPHGAPHSFGPYGLRHVNGAGQEFREFLQAQRLASAASFFRARGNSYAT